MKLVVDTNIIISAFLKSGKSLRVIVSDKHTLYMPVDAIEEIQDHIEEISEKAGIEPKIATAIFDIITENIVVVDKETIKKRWKEADEVMGRIDKGDIPIIACAMEIEADAILTYDKDFEKQKRFKTLKPEMIE